MAIRVVIHPGISVQSSSAWVREPQLERADFAGGSALVQIAERGVEMGSQRSARPV